MMSHDQRGLHLAVMSIDSVAQAAIQSAHGAVADPDALAALPTRFPVQVAQQTRVFLEYQAKALNTSIAGLAGLILDQVAAETVRQRTRSTDAEERGPAAQPTGSRNGE
jgi:hypothetical protein